MATASRPSVKTLGFRLLSVLDSIVETDRRPPGFDGRFAVGVRGNDKTLWWVADFGRTASTAFADTSPTDVAFSVQLDIPEAEQVILRGALPRDLKGVAFDGDLGVLDNFVGRYLTKHAPVAVRARSGKQ